MYKYLFLLLFIIACNSNPQSVNFHIDFQDNSVYESYYKAGNPGNEVIIVKTEYNANIFENELETADTSYVDNSLFFKNLEIDYWQYLFTFGQDSTLFVVERTIDSLFVNYNDSLFTFDLLNYSSTVSTFDEDEFPSIIEPLVASETNQTAIDSLNAEYHWFKTYDEWKEEVIEEFQ
ncbi:MAG: hypothetical protein K8S23_14595 [Candidatus Cloacimonetes bacterium]|nr:hypothetical protein [Candidatus Cloacimonadota bacterium]